ncbi:hypothetical protein D0962_37745 [Leptolyngbyaceae cyanobacterium CCMR0082]|uniref:Transposase IS4-like domain-containing protein n=1 Tax=Adonisia turfae CCMR0082 TaxID=2304604 RepID=A0A6M0S370_9CYAN|nr:transposase [Adonisia turfae]NEZ62740.1 hypothetical protein [Adonisia turfae CCMR0082]NEZ68397.1 hypothetical protein [Adonisia turfae CCMR0082]
MELYERIEQIIVTLRPAFSRESTFEWFVLLIWGALLATQPPAVTSYLNALGIGAEYYHHALHWFHSSGYEMDRVCRRWGRWLSEQPYGYRLNGKRVYVGDGIKVSKEGRKMPGVKRLHQESETMSKPEWIRGHYFSAIGMLIGVDQALFVSLILLKLHDGLVVSPEATPPTLTEKMAQLCRTVMEPGSYVVLDAYYACAPVLKILRQHSAHLISRARISTVARAEFCLNPSVIKRGRPRQWGAKIKLRDLFKESSGWPKHVCSLYGKSVTIAYECFELYWDSPTQTVLFVLTQQDDGRQMILLSSDVTLSGKLIIETYAKRFKIEVAFRTLVLRLGGFAYRFWLKTLDKLPTWPRSMVLADYDEKVQTQILAKVETFERFVNLNAIALGLLQILALESPDLIWNGFPAWFRTLPNHGYPSERIVRMTLQNQREINLAKSKPTLLLAKLLARKLTTPRPMSKQALVA